MYNETNQERVKEYLSCLETNMNNPYIDHIVIFYEKSTKPDNFLPILRKYDVELAFIRHRPVFDEFFEHCNCYYPNRRCVVANADILFVHDQSFNLLENVDLSDKILTITRYNQINQLPYLNIVPGITITNQYGDLKTQHNLGCSIDTWIFETPLTIDFKCSYMLGTVRCDSSLNYQIKKSKKYTPYNPCKDFISIHEHKGWSPKKYGIVKDLDGQLYNIHEWDKLCAKRGDHFANVQFCNIEKIETKMDYKSLTQ